MDGDTLLEARKTFSLYWQIARMLAIFIAAMSALALLEDNNSVPLIPYFRSLLETFSNLLAIVFLPFETVIIKAFSKFGITVSLGPIFRAGLVACAAIMFAITRHFWPYATTFRSKLYFAFVLARLALIFFLIALFAGGVFFDVVVFVLRQLVIDVMPYLQAHPDFVGLWQFGTLVSILLFGGLGLFALLPSRVAKISNAEIQEAVLYIGRRVAIDLLAIFVVIFLSLAYNYIRSV